MTVKASQAAIVELRALLTEVSDRAPVARGYAFEAFLDRLFAEHNLAPRKAFRLKGEQIDGSFELNGSHYLVEAKWQTKRMDQSDLLVFSGKISGKAQWSRGVLISYSGFTDDGLHAFSIGKATNLICMNRDDLAFVLAGGYGLADILNRKVRRAAEENAAFVPAATLFK